MKSNSDCVFCKIVNREISSKKLLENKNFIVIEDANPKVEGHCLVIPKRHSNNFLDFPKRDYEDFLNTVREAVGQFVGDFNLVVNNGSVAGQVVNHFHLHVLPRKLDDGFNLNC